MSLIRSERTSAVLLLGAAVLGLVLANSPIGPTLLAATDAHIGPASVHLNLTVSQWISDGLLAVFFFIVAVELRHELTVGELNSWHRALHPAIAAVCGVVVPAAVYLAVAGGRGFPDGWPVPTATDIAFALGVLAVFGRGLPRRVRIFLLALAVLDDLIAILIIAVFFTNHPNLVDLGLAVITVAVFGLLSRMLHGRLRAPIAVLMVLDAVLTWVLVHNSGVHATLAGVALGLVMSREPARRVNHVLEPWSNGLVLPLFAFVSAMVVFPTVGLTGLAAPFWGILIALPVGKFIGITLGGWLGGLFTPGDGKHPMPFANILVIAALGGIGFTVSLLMNELAFAALPEVRDEGTLAVLLGSTVSIVAGSIAVVLRARVYRRAHPQH